MKEFTLHEKWNLDAAIIGYWRMGAKIGEMMMLTGLYHSEIKEIIYNYEKEINRAIKK